MFHWVWRLLRCQHEHTYRERRDVGNVKGVMHLVCERCGHAQPVVNRTNREHKHVVKSTAAITKRQARREKPAKVEPIERRRVG